MIRLDCTQGSPEWKAARLGIVTASGLDNLVTPVGLKPSKGADKYLRRLVAETILGVPLNDESSAFMERGTELEPEAAKWYAFAASVELETVGFLMRDDRRVGCSPDRLVGTDGGLEIKCPAADTHVGYFLDPVSLVAEYRGQVQGCLWVTGRAWWDVLSYNPVLPPVIQRVTPDAAYLAAVDREVTAFLARLDAALAKLAPEMAAKKAERDSNPFL